MPKQKTSSGKKAPGTGKLIFAASRQSADLLYASGLNAPDPFVWFSAPGIKAVVVSRLEYDRAVGECKKGVKVLGIEDFFPPSATAFPAGELLRLIAERHSVGKWIVPPDFPLSRADALRAAGIDVECAQGDFIPERRFKTARELERIKESLSVAQTVMTTVKSILAEAKVDKHGRLVHSGLPLTSETLKRQASIAAASLCCTVSDIIIACGPHGAEPHNTGGGPVHAGQPIVVDIFPHNPGTGYWGDLTRTFVKGKAPETVRRAHKAVLEANLLAKKMAAPGVKAAGLHTAVSKFFDRRGFKRDRVNGKNRGFIHSLGHGLGLEIHENPRLSPISRDILAEGDVFTIEPGLYYPEWGGIRIEDVAAIKDGTLHVLTDFDPELEIP